MEVEKISSEVMETRMCVLDLICALILFLNY